MKENTFHIALNENNSEGNRDNLNQLIEILKNLRLETIELKEEEKMPTSHEKWLLLDVKESEFKVKQAGRNDLYNSSCECLFFRDTKIAETTICYSCYPLDTSYTKVKTKDLKNLKTLIDVKPNVEKKGIERTF